MGVSCPAFFIWPLRCRHIPEPHERHSSVGCALLNAARREFNFVAFHVFAATSRGPISGFSRLTALSRASIGLAIWWCWSANAQHRRRDLDTLRLMACRSIYLTIACRRWIGAASPDCSAKPSAEPVRTAPRSGRGKLLRFVLLRAVHMVFRAWALQRQRLHLLISDGLQLNIRFFSSSSVRADDGGVTSYP